MIKICSKCKRKLDVREFSKYKRGKKGLRCQCKSCRSQQRKIYYRENKDEIVTKIKKYYQEHKEKISERKKTNYQENKEKLIKKAKENRYSKNNHCECGKLITNDSVRCYSCDNKGENNPLFNDWNSRKPYALDWTDKLRESIRKRDNYICQNCGIIEEEHIIVFGQVLHIHHIDYNKKNCNGNNLIALCGSCNIRANHNRDYWQNYYSTKILIIKEKEL